MTEPDWTRYEAVVGKRWSYYAPRFDRFARGGWLSWNWAALFGTLAWLRYRKLYAWSWLYFFVSTPVLLAAFLIVEGGQDLCERALVPLENVFGLFGFAIMPLLALGWVLPPLFADRVYFARVKALVERGLDDDAKHAGTGGIAGALGLQFLVLFIVAITIPSYGSYTYRARVFEGVSLASSLKTPMAEYLAEYGRLPANIEEISDQVSGEYVRTLTVLTNGTIRAEFGDAAELLEGHSIRITPSLSDREIEAWTCGSDDLPRQCLPVDCRNRLP